ncbi:hypothetical protein HanRHA438_Chr14g0630711 [Helianthus annuus]|nr:hypothetical protein HanRHA438_Chr14g0630711 [Helianthus annuus]
MKMVNMPKPQGRFWQFTLKKPEKKKAEKIKNSKKSEIKNFFKNPKNKNKKKIIPKKIRKIKNTKK